MKYLISAFFAFLFLLTLNVYSQNNKVIAGPMVSFVDSYGTQMWFLLESDAEKITVDVRPVSYTHLTLPTICSV